MMIGYSLMILLFEQLRACSVVEVQTGHVCRGAPNETQVVPDVVGFTPPRLPKCGYICTEPKPGGRITTIFRRKHLWMPHDKPDPNVVSEPMANSNIFQVRPSSIDFMVRQHG